MNVPSSLMFLSNQSLKECHESYICTWKIRKDGPIQKTLKKTFIFSIMCKTEIKVTWDDMVYKELWQVPLSATLLLSLAYER